MKNIIYENKEKNVKIFEEGGKILVKIENIENKNFLIEEQENEFSVKIIERKEEKKKMKRKILKLYKSDLLNIKMTEGLMRFSYREGGFVNVKEIFIPKENFEKLLDALKKNEEVIIQYLVLSETNSIKKRIKTTRGVFEGFTIGEEDEDE